MLVLVLVLVLVPVLVLVLGFCRPDVLIGQFDILTTDGHG
jgi:hypothetical protein